MAELFGSLLLSLRIALSATGIVALLGIPVAYFLARRRFVGKSLLETLLMMPLVLPPTVIGYFIIVVIGKRGPIGQLFESAFGYRFVFSEAGAVIAAVVVSFPLLLLPARAAFASVETEYEQIAQIFGASRWQIFWHVNLPLARRGVISGLLLAFARGLGEFGATMMIFGNREGHRTLPISVYQDYVDNNWRAAVPAVILLTLVSLLVLLVYNRRPSSQGIIGSAS